jgi:short-subunit dehydrogenase
MVDAERFCERYGPCALIAGAAVGLGAAYARELAGYGLDVILLDRDERALRATADEIRSTAGVEVKPVRIDLARPDLLDAIQPVIAGHEIGLVVCNAALGTVAPFLELDAAHLERMLDVNCRAPLRLVRALAPAMVGRRRGGLVLMSSLAGNIGSAQIAMYAATKAFALVLADGLWAELVPHGVDVLAVQPGSTRTPGWLSSQPGDDTSMPAMEPADVVREALAALGNAPNVVAGELNRQGAAALAHIARRDAIAFLSGITGQLQRNDGREPPA